MINKAEFKQLFDRHFDDLRTFIFYRCGNLDMAQDMAQDVFMKVWEKRENLNNQNLKSLLFKMGNDLVISNYRKEAVRNDFAQCATAQGAMTQDACQSPEDDMIYQELVAAYAKALELMPEANRTVFLMSRNEELKYHEIAERLGISIKTVEKRMSAALQYLRTKLL